MKSNESKREFFYCRLREELCAMGYWIFEEPHKVEPGDCAESFKQLDCDAKREAKSLADLMGPAPTRPEPVQPWERQAADWFAKNHFEITGKRVPMPQNWDDPANTSPQRSLEEWKATDTTSSLSASGDEKSSSGTRSSGNKNRAQRERSSSIAGMTRLISASRSRP